MAGLLDGVLPTIFSQADRAKRYIGGLLSDPIGRIQQAGGQAVDDLTKIGLLSQQAFSDPRNPMKMQDNAASKQLVDAYLASVLNFAPAGITVWHGSPHKFDRFDSSKIGTGEGAQAYGHGLYLAENPSVAREYQEKLSSVGGAKNLASQYGDIDKGIDEAQRRIASYKELIANGGGGAMERAQRMLNLSEKNLQDLSAMKAGLPENTGALYKVDLPDEQIAKMLDWDKPMSKQSATVKKAWQESKKLLPSNALDDLGGDLSLMYGKDVTPLDFLNTWESLGQKAGGEAALKQFGVPGIRYLDGGSRGTGGGTSNFVVFPGNENILSILERNGQPLR